jgi:hypothetical protein
MAAETLPTWLSILLGGIAATIPQVVSSVIQSRAATKQDERREQQVIQQEVRQARRERETNLWNLELDKFRELERFLSELMMATYTNENRAIELLALREKVSIGFLSYGTIASDLDELLTLYVRLRNDYPTPDAKATSLLLQRCHEIIRNCRNALIVGVPKLNLPNDLEN